MAFERLLRIECGFQNAIQIEKATRWVWDLRCYWHICLRETFQLIYLLNGGMDACRLSLQISAFCFLFVLQISSLEIIVIYIILINRFECEYRCAADICLLPFKCKWSAALNCGDAHLIKREL